MQHALAPVGGADPDRIHAVEDVQLGEGDRPDAVEGHGVAGHHRIEPAHSPGPPGGRPILFAHLPDPLPGCIQQLGGHRAIADPGAKRLVNADGRAHPAGRDAGPGQRSTGRGRGRGHIGIGAEVQVEHAPLGPLQQDVVASVQRPLDQREDVPNERIEALPILGVRRQDLVAVHRGDPIEVLEQGVHHFPQNEVELLLQEAGLLQVPYPEADPADLVGIGRPNASPGGTQPVIAALPLLELVQDGVPGHDHVRPVRDDQVVDADPARLHLVHLLEQHARVEHHPVADDAGGARIQNPRWDQVEAKLLAATDHGMTGVVPALRADNHAGPLGQEVDDLPLALVPPLPADEDGDHLALPAPIEVDELRLLVDEEQLDFSHRTVAVFPYQDLGDVALVVGQVVVVHPLAINEQHEIGVLLQAIVDNDIVSHKIMECVHR